MRGTLEALHLQEQLAAANAERESDASSYEAKIARLRAIQRAALDAGSARGRQLLYTESLRNTDRIPSSMSWRGEDWECRLRGLLARVTAQAGGDGRPQAGMHSRL